MTRFVLAVAVLAGCDHLFDLKDVSVYDAALSPDSSPPGDVPVPLAHDEDGDGVDDAVDNCPSVSNPGQEDLDEDTVGNVCDPNSEKGGDRIVFFASFATAPDPARWTSTGGDWHADADSLTQGAVASSTGYEYQLDVSMPPLNTPTIETRIDNFGGLLAGVTLITSSGTVYCNLSEPQPNLMLHDSRTMLADQYAPFGTGGIAPFRIIASAYNPAVSKTACVGISANTTTETLPVQGIDVPLTEAHVGLSTYQGSARFLSVTVYDRVQ